MNQYTKKNKLIIFLMSLIIMITLFLSTKQILSRGQEITALINKGAFIDISSKINDKILLLESIANLKYIKDESIPIQERALSLRPFQEKYDFLMIALMDKDGNTSSSLEGGLADLSDRAYFQKVKKTKQNVISDVIISRTTGEENIVIVHPILDINDDFNGAVFISIRLTDLINLKNTYGASSQGYTTTILDDEMNVIAGDFKANFLQLKDDLISCEPTGVFFKKRNGDLHFIAFNKKHLSNWYIITDLNISKYFFGTWASTLIIIFVFTILFLMIFKSFDINKKIEIQPLLDSLNQDYLSGVYNRKYLEDYIKNYFKKESLKSFKSAFIILDIDNFKAINDELGHTTGDYVIRESANKIKDIFYDNSVISRIGGDEFIIFVESIDNEKTVINKIKTLLTLMNTTYGRNEKNIVISASIGITFIGDEYYNFINLYNEADSALYKAKKAGKNCAYVSNEIDNQLIKVNKNSI